MVNRVPHLELTLITLSALRCHLQERPRLVENREIASSSEAKLKMGFIPLGHEVRWVIQNSMLSSWQMEVLQNEESTGDQSWSLKEAYNNQLLLESFANVWEFDCSVCGHDETFICELDDTALENRDIRLKRAVCVQCGLLIPKNCPLLVDELCKDQVDEVRPRLLKEFGIE